MVPGELRALCPDGTVLFVTYGKPEHWRPFDGAAGLDNWRAILTLDRSWWVTVRRGGSAFGWPVIRERYRDRADAEARAKSLAALAERGDLPTKGYPRFPWRRWGPPDVRALPRIRPGAR
jgi:hypothetical protein